MLLGRMGVDCREPRPHDAPEEPTPGDEGGFVRELLMAYNYRPSRAEPLYDLARYFRERGDNQSSLLFSETGMKIPLPSDLLFVNEFVYKTGLKEEFSIVRFTTRSGANRVSR